jgi:hypothetical protein
MTNENRHPLVVAYGMGVDSTAMLCGMADRGIRPDLILFANVGSEKQSTYDYERVMNTWLASVKFPGITVVRYRPKNFKHWPPYYSLEENCLTNGTLPSKAFGFGSCSLKWKAAPQHKFLKGWAPAIRAWAHGEKVLKAIGYDCSSRDQQRAGKASTYQDPYGDLYDYWYPLQEWGWTREDCEREIAAHGLPIPEKSSCFFCPAMKPAEVDALPADKLARIVLMEARAKPRLRNVEGLWRRSTRTRPGSMTEYIRDRGLLSPERIARIQEVPAELIDYQRAWADNETRQPFTEYLKEAL